MTYPWTWPKFTAVTLINKYLLARTIKWEPLIQSLQTWQFYLPCHAYYLARFWRNFTRKYLPNFVLIIWICVFFKVKQLWTYISNGWSDWCEIKRRCMGWILGILCGLGLWPRSLPWSWIFQGQISKSPSGIVGLIDVKWKGSKLTRYWADRMTVPFGPPMTLICNFQGQSLK